jgi:hypothetical protein
MLSSKVGIALQQPFVTTKEVRILKYESNSEGG